MIIHVTTAVIDQLLTRTLIAHVFYQTIYIIHVYIYWVLTTRHAYLTFESRVVIGIREDHLLLGPSVRQ